MRRFEITMINMVVQKGILEMLETAQNTNAASFNDFTKISIKNRHLSSSTVSKRLERLLKAEVIKEVITKSKTGRRVIAYRTTEKGKKVIERLKEINEELAISNSK